MWVGGCLESAAEEDLSVFRVSAKKNWFGRGERFAPYYQFFLLSIKF